MTHMEAGVIYSFEEKSYPYQKFVYKREYIPDHLISRAFIWVENRIRLLELVNCWNSRNSMWKYWV